MSSLCIKTNNDEILKYLQNEFKDFNMLNVSFSSNEFKNYRNVIIHYKGTDFELFYTKLATILSYLVIEYFENPIIKTILISNYKCNIYQKLSQTYVFVCIFSVTLYISLFHQQHLRLCTQIYF